VSEPRFDVEQIFDEDYLYFYEAFLSDERTDAEVELLWRLLELEPETEVLDAPCGHGRISNRLAARGARVTGLDAMSLFLDLARRDAAERGVDVDYVEGDLRSLPWDSRFDVVLNWFTSFGYFGDDDNRRVLHEARRALKPGGRLVLDVHSRDAFQRHRLPVTMAERDGDLMVDRHSFDVLAGRIETERFVVRGGKVRRFTFSVRFFTFTELRDWLLQAGFADVEAYDRETGETLSGESRRMIVVARKPAENTA
jgi:SAM-dependent methyltransferase